MKRRILFSVLAVLLLLAMPVQAAGQGTGSIRVCLAYGESTGFLGSLTLFRIGELQQDGFLPEDIFAKTWEAGRELSAAELARTLAALAARENAAGITEGINPDHQAVFRNLEPGIYLVVQREAASGYAKIEPFLVTVPASGGQVDASPKVRLPQKEEPTLPNTGQAALPGIAMLCLGGVLVTLGLRLRKEK